MRRFHWAVLLGSLASAPALSQEVGVGQYEILIGSCADLVGANRVRSVQMLDGARAYLDSINREGGVYGRKLRLLSYDDGGDLKQAVACFNKLRDQGVFAGAFFMSAPPASRYAPMAEYNRIPVLGFLSGARFLYEPVKHYVFPIHPSHRESISAIIDGGKDFDIHKVALVQEDNALGKSVADAVSWALAKRRAVPCEKASITQKMKVFKPLIDQLKAAGTQMVIVGAGSTNTAELIHASRQSGWEPIFVSVSNDPSVIERGSEMNGTIVLEPFPTADHDEFPTVARYRKLLKKIDRKAVPSVAGLEGFIDAMVLVEGLKRAGRSLTRDKFVDSLESLQAFDLGLDPRYKLSYSMENHPGVTAVTPTFISNGKEVPLDWALLKAQRSPSR